ncbi:CPBP family intramembrane metalloprotease [Bacillus sp. BRMEA1]|uniref:CPBP family intramembrane glutamic endopeptidase n=1 Tax=Neobacillus endophyticus TaxID=2738405 RepID=UPI001564245A|nr:CPBP family intramembrane glutamic endopeptidase [Neobacillus endophyticus]NRD81099.1 CPBP family intramembrane metalloprotease [Neobacillus endophyticus]
MTFLSVFLVSIVVGYPIWDYFYMKKGNFSNKSRMYLTVIIPQWVIVAIFFAYWFLTKRSFVDLFYVDNPILSSHADRLKATGIGAIIALVIYALIFIFSKKIKQVFSKWMHSQIDTIRFMLPITLKERILFVIVAITAGFCEEVVFRSVMLYYFEHLPFELSIISLIIVLSLLFGIVHLYQGWKGVLGTAYVGGILLYVFLVTGNLWLCILLHFLIDVKFAFTSNQKSSIDSQEIAV